jgi:hypothetical protein
VPVYDRAVYRCNRRAQESMHNRTQIEAAAIRYRLRALAPLQRRPLRLHRQSNAMEKPDMGIALHNFGIELKHNTRCAAERRGLKLMVNCATECRPSGRPSVRRALACQ